MIRSFLRAYFRPVDLVEVGTTTWLGMAIAAWAVVSVTAYPEALWIGGLLSAINLTAVSIMTAYYEYGGGS